MSFPENPKRQTTTAIYVTDLELLRDLAEAERRTKITVLRAALAAYARTSKTEKEKK